MALFVAEVEIKLEIIDGEHENNDREKRAVTGDAGEGAVSLDYGDQGGERGSVCTTSFATKRPLLRRCHTNGKMSQSSTSEGSKRAKQHCSSGENDQ